MQHCGQILSAKAYIVYKSINFMARVVLIGGPSSGKTSTIERIAAVGYAVVPEVAKDLILARGGLDPRNKSDYRLFQEEVVREQMRRESAFSGDCFLDRGIYDGVAYSLKNLGDIPDFLRQAISCHKGYDAIFSLDMLPFKKEIFRIEQDEQEAHDMHLRVIDVYQKYGFRVIPVPVMSVQERVNYILGRLK